MKTEVKWSIAFVWLVFIPTFCFLSWYGLYKLVMWLLYGQI